MSVIIMVIITVHGLLMVPDHSDHIVVSMVEMCCSLNLNSVTGIPTITQIRRSVNLSNFAQSRIRYCWLEWM